MPNNQRTFTRRKTLSTLTRRSIPTIAALSVFMGWGGIEALANAEQAVTEESSATEPLRFITAEYPPHQAAALRANGFDVIDIRRGSSAGVLEVDMIVNGMERSRLDASGVQYRTHEARPSNRALATFDFNVWRSWSQPGGLADEMRSLADQYPSLAKLVRFGETVQGQDLLALKVSANATKARDGRKPAVMYVSLQHAREWIVGEMNRRLLRYFLERYGSDTEVTQLVDNNELWFVLVANPDGYDYTFTPGNRLWRKNLADNDKDGVITTVDGVDPNRNWSFRWGYDNEGSSEIPSSAVYRGPSPSSEPETQALDALVARVRPAFFINYHSAAELLLYGNGWQVATPEPDDNIHVALLGTDTTPAVEGYDPDPSSELYATNGETTNHLSYVHGVVAYTPELDTCESAEDLLPDDDFGDDYCESNGRSIFEFPDDERLIQLVFEKNLPLALAVAHSAANPNDPVSIVGTPAVDFKVDTFDVSYGRRQRVAVEMKKKFRRRRMHYKINGGRKQTTKVRRWRGGKVYGDAGTNHYAEYRGIVRRARAGDSVTVWFSARDDGHPVTSDKFTYTVTQDHPAEVLLLVNEDYNGFSPEQPDVTAPRYADVYVEAINRAGFSVDVWDVTAQGVPHDLGVLRHYDLVVWELGDNRLTQEADDVVVETPFGPQRDTSVSEDQHFMTLALRDFINEGGRLLQTGEYAGFFGSFTFLGGAYYGLNGDPFAPCVITDSFFRDCLIYSNDFAQYYQGVFGRSDLGPPVAAEADRGPLRGTFQINGAEVPNSGTFLVTSDVLPEDRFPQFSSTASMLYKSSPFAPFDGDYFMASGDSGAAWKRLTREVDLANATSAQLDFKLSYRITPGFDHIIIEARTAGGTDYTTLVDMNGGTSSAPHVVCSAITQLHPELLNYLTPGDPTCLSTGTTGAWNAFTGDSGGWTDVAVDLSSYAGSVVELSISYIADQFAGSPGVFVDDVAITIDGSSTLTDFENDTGAWTVPGPPDSSPRLPEDWARTAATSPAVVSTANTVTFGFGLEAIASTEERSRLIGQALRYLQKQRNR